MDENHMHALFSTKINPHFHNQGNVLNRRLQELFPCLSPVFLLLGSLVSVGGKPIPNRAPPVVLVWNSAVAGRRHSQWPCPATSWLERIPTGRWLSTGSAPPMNDDIEPASSHSWTVPPAPSPPPSERLELLSMRPAASFSSMLKFRPMRSPVKRLDYSWMKIR